MPKVLVTGGDSKVENTDEQAASRVDAEELAGLEVEENCCRCSVDRRRQLCELVSGHRR